MFSKTAYGEQQAIDPLNPYLYTLLQRKFASIKVANEGVPAYITTYPDPLRPGRVVTKADCWGEYYRVCCPYCGDTQHRLWINHRYGADVEFGRRTNTHLAVCYKNSCTSHAGMRDQLAAFIFGTTKNFRRAPIKTVVAEYTPPVVQAPGQIESLQDLPDTHPAVQYVRSRSFDPRVLAQQFDIGFCVAVDDDSYAMAKNRLYIPIYFEGNLVGWQARTLISNFAGPKYIFMRGLAKSRLLYNYDAAAIRPFVVVVEGVPSVWRLGAASVCLFGKSMSLFQQMLLAKTWPDKPVFLMLDNDAQIEMRQATALLKQKNVQAIPVPLPDARDPADYTRDDLCAMLSAAATEHGVTCDIASGLNEETA